MANILTAAEGATILRCSATDANLLALLPQIDGYIRTATGRDWAADTTIHVTAKAAARMLLVLWHEDPGQMGNTGGALAPGLRAVLTQLEALALRYKTFPGNAGAGPVQLPGANAGDTVSSLVGKIGLTGDQHTLFESVISVDDEIQQTSGSDLSAYWFQALLTPVGDL